VSIQVPVEVALSAFDVLVGCAGLYEHVRRDSKVIFYTFFCSERKFGRWWQKFLIDQYQSSFGRYRVAHES
jgi:hypothetical protein